MMPATGYCEQLTLFLLIFSQLHMELQLHQMNPTTPVRQLCLAFCQAAQKLCAHLKARVHAAGDVIKAFVSARGGAIAN